MWYINVTKAMLLESATSYSERLCYSGRLSPTRSPRYVVILMVKWYGSEVPTAFELHNVIQPLILSVNVELFSYHLLECSFTKKWKHHISKDFHNQFVEYKLAVSICFRISPEINSYYNTRSLMKLQTTVSAFLFLCGGKVFKGKTSWVCTYLK